jgi:hypothetical protein
MNCYGPTAGVVRRAAFIAVGGFASNTFGTADDAWQLYAALTLAGYRLEAHSDVLFARGFEARDGIVGGGGVEPLLEPSFAAMTRAVDAPMAALRHSPLRALPMFVIIIIIIVVVVVVVVVLQLLLYMLTRYWARRYFVHLFNAFNEAATNHRDALSRQQAKYIDIFHISGSTYE